MHRRTFVVSTGGALCAAVAGCTDFLGDDGPEATVEGYFDALDEGDIDTLEDLTHSANPIDWSEVEPEELEDVEIDSVETELVEEDLSLEELEEETGFIADGDLEQIADEEETAIVSADVTRELEGDEEREEEEILLATEDGDWKLLE